MERDEIDDSFVRGFLSAVWANIWLGLAVFVFFSTLWASTALSLTMIVVFGYRLWEATFSKIHNAQLASVRIALRNLAAQELLRTGEAVTLDEALIKAERLAESHTPAFNLQTAAFTAAGRLAGAIIGCATELAWITGCAFAGLKFRSSVEAYIDQAVKLAT